MPVTRFIEISPSGTVLDDVEGHTVITGLNDAFDAGESFVILPYEIMADKDEVIVLWKRTADEVLKCQLSSSNTN
jgi:hypothetical protein